MTLPISVYDPNIPASAMWEKHISSLASTTMEFDEAMLGIYSGGHWEGELLKGLSLPYTPTAQLLCLFPHPSKHHWFPSWTQVQQYPDVSVRDGDPRDSDPRDSDPSQTTSGIDYSLRIMFGRIYRGCSLQLIKPPTPGTKAIYCSTMDGKDAQLVATVPGIELHIDSRIKYVLVDISPDFSLWPRNLSQRCWDTDEGHPHLPIWPKSVIIVCEEVDTFASEHPPAVIEYRLRRVTTLEWECRQPDKPDGCWLPFKPSLEHMRSIVCSAKGRKFLKSLDNEGTDNSDTEGTDISDNEGTDSPENEVANSPENEGTDNPDNEDTDYPDNEGTDNPDNEGTDSPENEVANSQDNEYIDLDVFCDPVAVASLLSQEPSQWPRYEVYLV